FGTPLMRCPFLGLFLHRRRPWDLAAGRKGRKVNALNQSDGSRTSSVYALTPGVAFTRVLVRFGRSKGPYLPFSCEYQQNLPSNDLDRWRGRPRRGTRPWCSLKRRRCPGVGLTATQIEE